MDDRQITGANPLDEIAAGFAPELDVATGKWFGKPCLKVGRKVFAALWGGDMAFKLSGAAHAEALQIKGAHLFDPRGEGHPMKEWVQIPAAQSSTWSRFARLACAYVAGAAQAKKDGLISGLVETRGKILHAVSALSPAEADQVFLGTWSVKDLLAHLAGWDYTNKEAVQQILAGQHPSFWEHYDRDWQTYNARLVQRYKKDDLAALITSVQASHQDLISYLQSVPAEAYGKHKKIGTLLRAEIKDEKTHHEQIEGLWTSTHSST